MQIFFRRGTVLAASVVLSLGLGSTIRAENDRTTNAHAIAQGNERASAFEKPVPLGFAKLIVEDLDAMSRFYQALCGFEEENRADARIGGRPIREVHFRSDPPGTGIFALTKFLDAKQPETRALILGFITSDINGFVARSTTAGGTVVDPVQVDPEHGVKVAFVRDIEGNLIEVVELL